jgi:hypothetical protein
VTIRRIGGGVVGRDETNKDGRYFVRFAGTRGRYQSRVRASFFVTPTGNEIRCLADRSPIISIRRR